MRLLEYKDFTINFRNPVSFIKQWWNYKDKIRGLLIWLGYCWKHDMCGIWVVFGLRFIGFEFCITIYTKG